MKKLEIMNKLSRSFGRAGLQLKKHSPEILVVTGVIGTVASTIMACKATTKLDDILAEAQDRLDSVKDYIETDEYAEKYTEEEGKKAIALTYVKTGLEVAKLYAPAVAVGTLSITAILAGHNITRKRNVALAAAYTAVDTAFKDYRGRVVSRFGEALDKELRYNIKTKEVEEVVQNEDGSQEIVKKTVNVVEDGPSEYAKFFDEYCSGWTPDPEYNLNCLRDQQKYANYLLKKKGHVFLNEVYDLLGIERTKAGQIVGWIYDIDNPNGDNQIDFGIYDINNPDKRQFVNGLEKSILLDFNVDGPILNMI